MGKFIHQEQNWTPIFNNSFFSDSFELRTPSFYLYPLDNKYHCYGCGIKGSGPLTLARALAGNNNTYTPHQLLFLFVFRNAVGYELENRKSLIKNDVI